MNNINNLHKLILIVDDEPFNLMGLLLIMKISFKEFGISEKQVDDMVY